MATTPRDPYQLNNPSVIQAARQREASKVGVPEVTGTPLPKDKPLDYAEKTTGTFGSGWTPQGGKSGGVGLPPAHITSQTPQQRADQDAFDRSQGFKSIPTPLDRSANVQPAQQPAVPTTPTVAAPVNTAAATPTRATGGSPLDILSGFAPTAPGQGVSVGGARPQLNTSLTNPGPVFQTPQVQPSRAEQAGAAVRGVVSRGVDTLGRAELGATDAVTGAIKSAATRVANPISTGLSAVGGFARGLLGRSTAAGATNATAAQFQQPTQKNGGRTVTPTSPQLNIDRSDQSLGKFGLSDAEFSRRKLAFAGF